MKIKNFTLNSVDQVSVKIVGEVLRAFHIEAVTAEEPADFDKFEIFNEFKYEKVFTKLFIEKTESKNFSKPQNIFVPKKNAVRKFTGLSKKIFTELLPRI